MGQSNSVLGLIVMVAALWTCNAFVLWSLLKYVFHLEPGFGACFATAISIGFAQAFAIIPAFCIGGMASVALGAAVGPIGVIVGVVGSLCFGLYLWGTWSVTMIVDGYGCSRPQGRWILLCYVILSTVLGSFMRGSLSSAGIGPKDPFEEAAATRSQAASDRNAAIDMAFKDLNIETGEEGESDGGGTAARPPAPAAEPPAGETAPETEPPPALPVAAEEPAPAAAPASEAPAASPWGKKSPSAATTSAAAPVAASAPANPASAPAAAPAAAAAPAMPATAATTTDASAPAAAPTVGDIALGDEAIAEAKKKWSEYDFDASIKAAEKALAHYKKVYISTHEKVVSTEKMIATAKVMRDKAKAK